MKYLKLLLLCSIVFLFTGCSIQNYYFPMSELTQSKVYKYECKADPSKTEYWKITSNIKENSLTTEAYDANLVQYEYFKEKFTSEGSILSEFISYNTSNGEKKAIVNTPKELDVFKWDTSEPYAYSSSYIDPDHGQISFEKKRRFLDKENFSILGKNQKTLKFEDQYTTHVARQKQSYKKVQWSYYVEGIGLAKMDKTYSDGSRVLLELTEIMTLAEWQKNI